MIVGGREEHFVDESSNPVAAVYTAHPRSKARV